MEGTGCTSEGPEADLSVQVFIVAHVLVMDIHFFLVLSGK